MNAVTALDIALDEKQAIADAFGRAAETYDRHAEFQRDVGHRLLDKLPQDLNGKRILDLGCGTGYFSQKLLERGATVVCGDLSLAMLDVAKRRCNDSKRAAFYQVDAECLPFDRGEFDYVFSSLALQWCEDLSLPLSEAKRVTRQGGQVLFSTLLEGSLYELAMAWSEIDSYQHVNDFISPNRLKIALAQSHCANHDLDLPTITVWYPTAFAVMRDLKGIGATHVSGRGQGLTSRKTLNQVEMAYQKFKNQQGLLPATYQVCLGVIQHD
ncbi:malonyl-ACP O-methyltransferase BioC [Vibrio agarivorans]|uniref:malonyl-ACP O-methyltransferase BioC n=1 Tax=Vibrio agarivorans TaxID=153622 RepID=UPI0025B3D71D|nr:malonyl-ACP O-methyltransferase BioC [Vibrio agarivorans]MDN3662930.1 malonyl-ACP O-methyltransferase BioC [Vibrio agarivorans]